VLATSNDPSDDALSGTALRHNLQVFRGPLEDVLARFALATADLVEDQVIVRLTADNLVPDGEFVETLVRAFLTARVEYLSVDGVDGPQPY